MAALSSYPDLPPDLNVEAWLVVIARRKSLDIIRAASRRAIPVAEVPEAEVAQEPDPLAEFDLTALTLRQRAAVTHRYLDGLPYDEVAALIGGSVVAARRAAADGIAALRQQINDTRQQINDTRQQSNDTKRNGETDVE